MDCNAKRQTTTFLVDAFSIKKEIIKHQINESEKGQDYIIIRKIDQTHWIPF